MSTIYSTTTLIISDSDLESFQKFFPDKIIDRKYIQRAGNTAVFLMDHNNLITGLMVGNFTVYRFIITEMKCLDIYDEREFILITLELLPIITLKIKDNDLLKRLATIRIDKNAVFTRSEDNYLQSAQKQEGQEVEVYDSHVSTLPDVAAKEGPDSSLKKRRGSPQSIQEVEVYDSHVSTLPDVAAKEGPDSSLKKRRGRPPSRQVEKKIRVDDVNVKRSERKRNTPW
jgi:hypothetical protein